MKKIAVLVIGIIISTLAFAQQNSHRFIGAGFTNDSYFIKFYCHFQEAVVKYDTNYLSKIVLYPLTVYDSSRKKIVIKNKASFFHFYRRIFSRSLIDIILNQKADDFIVNDSNIGTIHGEVWFTYFQLPRDKLPKIYLIAVNNIKYLH